MLFFEGRWYHTDDLRRDIAALQDMFAHSGLQVGDPVALAEVNSYGFVAAYLAILLYGGVVVPLNPAMPAPEMHKVLHRSGVVGAIVGDALQPLFENESVISEHKLKFVAVIVSAPFPADVPIFTLLAGSWSLTTPIDVEVRTRASSLTADHGAILLYTSGTTGVPKGVLLTHKQVMATARNVAESHDLTREDICYAFLPLFHINAQIIGLLSTLTSGGRMVLERKFSASRFWSTIAEQRITWVSAVPTIIAILIKSPGDLPVGHTLRFVRSASAPLPSLHARTFEARFGIPLVESYGMTEAASQICINPVPPGMRKIGSAGIPWGVVLQVVNDRDEYLGKGTIGEIVIRGDSVITQYASGDETGNSFRNGWFHTGDLGYLDDDGYVFITGRSKEMINRAGQKISPREVEEVIGQHVGVSSVAVIGLPDDMYGEKVVAYVVPELKWRRREGALQGALRQLCASSISAYKCPVEFHVVDEVPLGPTGKIQRGRLRQQVLAACGVN